MSKSPLVCYTRLSPNHSGKRTHAIDTITIHCMAGNLTVESCGALFAEASRQASSNYGIGSDGRIALYVDEANRSWCSSDAANDHRAVTIEVANNGGAPDWPVSDAAYAALLDLVTDICKRNGIKKLLWQADKSLIGRVDRQNMTVHRWFAAKACPGDYLYNRHGEIAAEVNKRLNAAITEEDDEMTQEQFNEMWLAMRKGLQDNDSSEYSAQAREWAVGSGLIRGGDSGEFNGMWEDLMTREQLVTVLYRFAQLIGKV